ncbi:MAG: HNH endonuclease [Ignavibacteriales bacterium]
MKFGYIIIAAIIIIILLYFLFHHKKEEQKPLQPQVTPTQTAKPAQPTIGHRTKTSGCKVNGPFPDSACTPGAVIPGVTKEQVCTPGYAKSVRNVTEDVKDEVYREYRITHHSPGEYEVDHHISLELGGSNDISNLWPEAANPRPGYHEKDKVENYLHKEVCAGRISLEEAQKQIATNWLEVYKRLPKATRRKRR